MHIINSILICYDQSDDLYFLFLTNILELIIILLVTDII